MLDKYIIRRNKKQKDPTVKCRTQRMLYTPEKGDESNDISQCKIGQDF